MARNFRGPQRVGAKRLSSWFEFSTGSTTMTAAGGTLIASLNAAGLAMRPFTVVRTHVELALLSDQSGANELQVAAFGFAVVSDQATAVGVTAIPTPLTDLASDLWYLHQIIYADESVVTDRTRPQTRVSVDSKAMRKVDIGQDIVIVAEIDAVTGSGAVLISGGRFLVKVN